MFEIQQSQQEKKFSSLYLVEQINLFRSKEDNKSELLHRNLIAKIDLEFEDELTELKIQPSSYKDASGKQNKMYELTYEQSLQILMSESKIVRKGVIEVLKQQQQQIKELTQFKVPQTFKEALLLAVEQQEIIEQQEAKLLEQKPKVEFAEQLLQSTNGIDFGTSAKAMNLPFGRNKLFEICRKNGWLFGKNQPKQSLVDSGYFVVLETSFIHPKTMDNIITTKTLITAKGQEWLTKQLKRLNLL